MYYFYYYSCISSIIRLPTISTGGPAVRAKAANSWRLKCLSMAATPFRSRPMPGSDAGVEWLAAEIGAACKARRNEWPIASSPPFRPRPPIRSCWRRSVRGLCGQLRPSRALCRPARPFHSRCAGLVTGAVQPGPCTRHVVRLCGAPRGLVETLFRFDPTTGQAVPLRTEIRRAGYGCFARSGLEQIHRLGNACLEPAISVHVYGVECRASMFACEPGARSPDRRHGLVTARTEGVGSQTASAGWNGSRSSSIVTQRPFASPAKLDSLRY